MDSLATLGEASGVARVRPDDGNFGRRTGPHRQRDRPGQACRNITTSPLQPVKPCDKGCGEPRDVQRLIENLQCHLAAMRVPAHHGVETLPHSDRKHIRVVGEQEIGGARKNEFLGIDQIFAVPEALIVDAGDVQNTVSPVQQTRLVAQNAYANFRRLAGFITLAFHISLVITKAAEHAGIGPEPSELSNGGIQRIAFLRNHIAGDDS